MPPAMSHHAMVLGLAGALARERGWPAAVSPKMGHLRLGPTSRLSLATRGLVVVATVRFALDPDVRIETPDDLARAIGAGLADATMLIAGPQIR